ncbi:unnamed protein product [Ambrosiozyma monospora]|uniref:Unnamed protein product n=1 Tax=Ambrosiozyma monospora TaxID=43982 RepID=A0ACB5U7H3_AMBMO|nr:unnamed protein product [Ambrosiozyma monospora]
MARPQHLVGSKLHQPILLMVHMTPLCDALPQKLRLINYSLRELCTVHHFWKLFQNPVSCKDLLGNGRVSFSSKLSVRLEIIHTQISDQKKNDSRIDIQFVQKPIIERDVVFSYNIDESTPKNNLVAGLTVASAEEVKIDWEKSKNEIIRIPYTVPKS